MSQYGAYGFAQNGSGYRDILAHYYTGTAIGNLDPAQRVRVLLQSTRGDASFTGATRAGRRRLSARKHLLRAPSRRARSSCSPRAASGWAPTAALRVTGRGGEVTLRGRAANGRVSGAYRGALDFRAGTFSGVDVVNSLPLDSYLRGVVPDESPPSWPIEALKAQAVAARTYAMATMKPGADLRPLPRHALAGLRRRGGRGRLDEPGDRARPAARSSPTTASRSSRSSSRPPAGAPRTSRTRRSATSRGRG